MRLPITSSFHQKRGEPPYKGLTYFTEADADWFFGREVDTSILVNRLHDLNFLAIVGASGSGKSSLVRAGVVPVMKRNKPLPDESIPPLGKWQVVIITPTARPLLKLATTIFTQDRTQQAELHAQMLSNPDALQMAIVSRTQPTGHNLLLVFDQFEELFTLCKDDIVREAFIANLLTAASESCKIIITLRVDFYAQCLRHENLRQLLKTAQEPIGAMTVQGLKSAILEPASKGEWQFQAGLVEEILDDVGKEPGALPLLSHALLETWRRRRGRVLTLSGYREAGGVRGAIAQTAEATYNALTDTEQIVARRIFLRLTEPGEDTQVTRRRVSRKELGDGNTVQTVIQKLADPHVRLITTTQDSIDVAHEALIREWPRLRQWLDEDREGLRLHRQLTEAARIWAALEREPGALYRGTRLANLKEWASTKEDEMSDLEREFFIACTSQEKIEQEKERRQTRILRTALGIVLVLLIIALGAAAFAFSQSRNAQYQARVARSGELAARSLERLQQDSVESLLLAIRAVNETYRFDGTYTAEAQSALYRALIESPLRGVSKPNQEDDIVVAPCETTFPIFREPRSEWIWSNSDGDRILGRGEDGYFQLRDMDGNLISNFDIPREEWQTSMDFSPDGELIITAPSSGGGQLWDKDGNFLASLHGHAGYIHHFCFSPDGEFFVTSSHHGGTTRLWNREGNFIYSFRGGSSARFSADGKFIVTNDSKYGSGIPILWELEENSPIFLKGHSDWVVVTNV